ncbi:hypothetical protein [Streptomyces sp. TLI_105]|uniref:hypothetical protein n=1 Tax=Streptomyces sp. TLI_105 TaxID=1881019 RepID=UPI000895895A|nr:hypothetical protein [Streptomyces sp. TLI_105]SED31276.1 hypothetical protein SAMN05428939_4848 [Streptomyces sp. TLI_105]
MTEIGSQAATRHVSTPEAAHHVPAPDVTRHAPAPEADGPRPVAGPWDLVTVPVRQGLEAVDILRRAAAPAVGPVVHDGACDTLGFLVPPGTAAAWDLPGSACTRTSGRGLRLPELPELPEPAGDAPRPAGWLLPPGDTDPVTDPAVLREALGEAARLIEAADGCH